MSFSFHHVHLLCSDLEKTVDFFCNILGATLVCHKKFGGADGAMLDLNGTIINLRVAADTESVAGDASLLTYGYHHICVQTEDVDAAYADLSNKGIEFITAPKDTPDSRVAFFKGPDNIVIEMLQLRIAA